VLEFCCYFSVWCFCDEFVQVLFSPKRRHWLTVYGGSKCVHVYDSLAGTVSQTTRDTVRMLAGRRSRVQYSRTCTQQTKPGDCGCFALAYVTTVVLGGRAFSCVLMLSVYGKTVVLCVFYLSVLNCAFLPDSKNTCLFSELFVIDVCNCYSTSELVQWYTRYIYLC